MSLGLKQHRVFVCPKCKSRLVTDRGMISRDAYSNLHLCMHCGFQGPLFPEVPWKIAKNYPLGKRNFNPSRMPIFADKVTREKPWDRKTAATVWAIIVIILVLLALALAGQL